MEQDCLWTDCDSDSSTSINKDNKDNNRQSENDDIFKSEFKDSNIKVYGEDEFESSTSRTTSVKPNRHHMWIPLFWGEVSTQQSWHGHVCEFKRMHCMVTDTDCITHVMFHLVVFQAMWRRSQDSHITMFWQAHYERGGWRVVFCPEHAFIATILWRATMYSQLANIWLDGLYSNLWSRPSESRCHMSCKRPVWP